MENMGQKKFSAPVYILVVKEENIELLSLYLGNLRSLGLAFENVKGQSINVTFIRVSISYDSLYQFSILYDIGTQVVEENKYCPYFLAPIFFASPFSTPVSQLPARENGKLLNSEIIMIINKILETTKFSHREHDRGISKLIRRGILLDGYPLHDGPADENDYNNRSLLLRYWSNVKSLHKEQPLDLIQRYYGHEIAFYFAWLEYLNLMLVIPAVLGCVVFLISLVKVAFYPVVEIDDICQDQNNYVCPTCEHRSHCKFNKLSSYCSMSRWTYVFDNEFTIMFAVFMLFWATFFRTLWRRTEAKLRLRWNVDIDFDDAEGKIRDIYRETTKYRFYNPNTGEVEPYIPNIFNVLNYFASFCMFTAAILLIPVLVILNTVTGIEFRHFMGQYGNDFIKDNKVIISMVTGSTIQLLYIKLLAVFFGPLCVKLTNLENPRSQYAYDNAVLYKSFLFGFINNLAPLFYLAFIKGQLYTVPNKENPYLAHDVCSPQSCIVPLCMQIIFLLTLRSFVGNMGNLVKPKIKKLFKNIKEEQLKKIPQWEEEYFLQPCGRYLLTSEYSEMLVKYCMVTFFVASFPLGPICFLANNLIELRTDAYKLVKNHRRPVPRRKSGIGSWNGILLSVNYFSAATNAFVIAFTSDLIPNLIYKFQLHGVHSYYSYILSKFATKDYKPYQNLENKVEYCLYRGHFNPPDDPEPYSRDTDFWFNFTTKFIGILLFEHFILLCSAVLSYLIPQLPRSVQEKLNLKTLEDRRTLFESIEIGKDKEKQPLSEVIQYDY